MPNDKKQIDITKYTHYFNINAPPYYVQAFLLLLLGAGVGIASGYLIHNGIDGFFTSSAAAGIMIVTIPAILTTITSKAIQWRMKLKHAMFATMTITTIYAMVILVISAVYAVFHHYVLATVLLVLANAGIYGYWFVINKVAIGYRRSSIFLAMVQPVLNILFYIPFSQYLFTFSVPLGTILVKLYAGMIVFLVFGYLIIYIIDRPAKKVLSISGIAVFNAMVKQWLLDVNPKGDFLKGAGTSKDINVDVMVLKGRKSNGAVFVKPDIHYGPFSAVGGSTTPEQVGKFIEQKYKSVPFVMHGAVNAGDNPVSANQIFVMKKHISDLLERLSTEQAKAASGNISFGQKGNCRAINLRINDFNIVILSKAPLVTEDIDGDIGVSLERMVNKDRSKIMLIDAHNTRFESAPRDELKGVYKGSKYEKYYREAIAQSVSKMGFRNERLRFGAASVQLKPILNKKDIGGGYTSVGIFEFGSKRFAMIYFDSNNMLPGFRNEIVSHMKDTFGLDVELCTTDTHSVNSIALSASNALGRETRAREVIPILDRITGEALGRLEPVTVSNGNFMLKNFKIWGKGADELLLQASKESIYAFKHFVPLVIVVGFVVAAWIIYIV